MSEIKDALKSKPVRKLDPANLSNDQATLRALVGQLNAAPRGTEDAPVDTTKYSGPTGIGNTTIVTESIPDAQSQAAQAAANPKISSASPALPAASSGSSNVSSITPMPGQRSRRLVLTGRNIAQLIPQLGATEFSIDRAARQIAKLLFPAATDGDHGVQNVIDTIFAWGTGELTQKFPASLERAMFQYWMHNGNLSGAVNMDWTQYGRNAGFWTDSVVAQAKSFHEENPDKLIVFTGIPDTTALRYFQALGFQHWHVTGAPGLMSQSPFTSQLDNEVIRAVSSQRQGPKLRVIWVDPTPCNPRLWSVAEFVNHMK